MLFTIGLHFRFLVVFAFANPPVYRSDSNGLLALAAIKDLKSPKRHMIQGYDSTE
jgi:hypothetical protein